MMRIGIQSRSVASRSEVSGRLVSDKTEGEGAFYVPL